MLHATPHSTLPTRNRPIPSRMIGLRPTVSASLAYTDTDTAWASRYTENSHGNCANPPTSPTIDGTAVARIVASMAIRPVDTMRASRTGPRSERRPTPLREDGLTSRCKVGCPPGIPAAVQATGEGVAHPPRREARSVGMAAHYMSTTSTCPRNVPMNSKTAARHAGQISLFGAM